MNGFSNTSGRVEVVINGEWGTVSDDEWTLEDADVVCREVGYPNALLPYTLASFGEGFGRVWMSHMQCTGNESSLLECKHERFQQPYYSHMHDVGVLCEGKDSVVEIKCLII